MYRSRPTVTTQLLVFRGSNSPDDIESDQRYHGKRYSISICLRDIKQEKTYRENYTPKNHVQKEMLLGFESQALKTQEVTVMEC